MGKIEIASMLLLLVIIAISVIASIVIYSRKKKQEHSTKEESRPEEEWPKAREEHKIPDEERNVLEEKAPPPTEKPQRISCVEILQKDVEEPESIVKKSRKIPLGHRPSRRLEERDEIQPKQETRKCHPKPEIICWKRERQWILRVEVPEELLCKSGLAVLQNGSPLTEDESCESCWRLEKASGQVEICWDNEKTNITLGEEGYLLFKLSGQNHGRRVKFPSFGSYLVVVPDNWKRDEVLSGTPTAAPEQVSIIGYRGNYFDLEKGSEKRIAFINPERIPVQIKPNIPLFELVGTRMNDANEDKGPLFGEKPPQIRALDDQAWKDVQTIVVGEEGGGSGRWCMAFSPILGDLPSEVADRKAGWYFLRFYDLNDNLIESLEFRFISALREIRIHPPISPLPIEGGNREACIEFIHESSCIIQPVNDLACNIKIERENDKTIMTIPPDPTCDETQWLVAPQNGSQVEVNILVERVWLAIGEEYKVPSEWKDKLITLSSEDFAATSNKSLWLRLPRRHWIDEVHVGFEQSNDRQYPVISTEKTVCIPLRDFCDVIEVQDIGIHPFNLRIYLQGTTYTGTICKLEVMIKCKICNFMASEEEDMVHHIESVHIDEFFRLLTYEEMRALIPQLPLRIYKCSYCNFYTASDDYRKPTGTIEEHISKQCPNAPHGMGPPRISFRVVSDIIEIRNYYNSKLQLIHKCNFCGYHIYEATKYHMMQHFNEKHRNIVY